MALPNHWSVFNLKSTPFFQDTLRPGDERFPVELLFVARADEASRILKVIGSAESSRQAVPGEPGLGKTSLVQYVKSRATEEGYVAAPDPVSLMAEDTADRLLARLQRYVYEAFLLTPLTAGMAETEPMRQARQLVNAYRTSAAGGSLQYAGFGLGGQLGTAFHEGPFLAPAAVVPRLLAVLVETARKRHGEKFRGVVVHFDNLENLSEADAEKAGQVLRDLRDVLLIDGYHTLFVGTPDAIKAAIQHHAQLRGVFHQAEAVRPLTLEDVHALLRARYRHYRLNPDAEVREPITLDALAEMHGLFRGDLRGMLLACDQAAAEIVGFMGEDPATPMSAAAIRSVLAGRYRREMRERLGEASGGYLERLASWQDRPFSQKQLEEEWKVSQGFVSRLLKEFQAFGYVRVHAERDAARRNQYFLAGPGRLLLGAGPAAGASAPPGPR